MCPSTSGRLDDFLDSRLSRKSSIEASPGSPGSRRGGEKVKIVFPAPRCSFRTRGGEKGHMQSTNNPMMKDVATGGIGSQTVAQTVAQPHGVRPKRERIPVSEEPYEAAFFRGRPVLQTLEDIYAAFYIFYKHTCTLESLFVISIAVGSTLFYLHFKSDGDGVPYLASKLDFSTLSIAIVFPLTFSIQQAFSRRENALVALGDFKAL
eukprot:2606352-Pyramimonas_sp.AAC.1